MDLATPVPEYDACVALKSGSNGEQEDNLK
jgi:hypothetical protein